MNGSPLRALVVDDDSRWRALVTEILSDAGCQVTALARPPAATTGYHLAVLDVALDASEPDNREGLTLIDRLGDIPILFLSGLTDADVKADIERQPNVWGLMSKDAFSRDALIKFIQHAAALKASATSTPAVQGPRVLIVEDDPGWRAIYEDILADAGYTLHFAVSYGEARGWLQRMEFVLAIVDLHLISSASPQDNRDGFWLLRAARQRGIPTIVVSALGAPEDIDRAYEEFSVFAFVEKEGFDRRAFLHTLTEAIRSRSVEAKPSAPPMDAETDRLLNELTEREREVLALLAQGHTNRQIAQALRITPNTVKKHVDHILQKLEVSNRTGAVAVALRFGLKAHTATGENSSDS